MKNLPALRFIPLLAFAASAAWAQEKPLQLADLADLSLEQLTRITVTSASRREERLVDAPASIFVITADEIRRAGATSIPEILRLAPNLHIARVNTNQYAISARGFNNVLANKLLVMIDGRTVYTPLFSGVFWEAQDVSIEDIERIEVISGPGATLWGANAVNGVINIITNPAARTQGTLLHPRLGTDERGATVRHGGTAGEGAYRVYAKYFDRDTHRLTTGADIGDDSRRLQGGFRADWGSEAQGVTIQGDAYRGEVEHGPMRDFSGANLLARWRQSLGADSSLRVQAYYDRTERDHENSFAEKLDTLDIEAQHHMRLLTKHRVVWGGGVRHSRDRVLNSASQAFLPANRTLNWSNLFLQDEVAVSPRLNATVGVKAERNPYTGLEWLPNARIAWQPTTENLVWGALSRAVRAPSRLDRELNFPGNPPFQIVGNTIFDAEVAKVFEVGYRSQFSSVASFSATAFRHDYPNLRSIGSTSAGPVFKNDIEGHVTGIEGWGSWRVAPAWRLSGGFVVQDIDLHVKPGGVDLGGLASLGNDIERKVMLRSSWDITSRHELDVSVRHVGAMPNPVVPAYTSFDATATWRISRAIDLALTIQNVFDRKYSEWGPATNRSIAERTLLLTLWWRL